MSDSSDARQREATWLAGAAVTAGSQTLPALAAANGGPFDVVQAGLPRTQQTRQARIYVTRANFVDQRLAQQRVMDTYHFRLYCYWPIGSSTIAVDIAEQEQQNFDNALELLKQRIRGFVADHTHGGSFLNAAEAPSQVDFQFGDLPQDIGNGTLTCQVTYSCDDREFIG